MNAMEKLKVLLPHWAEHNREHASEVRRWRDEVEVSADVKLAESLEEVAYHMERAAALLNDAAEGMGITQTLTHAHHHHE
jgi:hypothetical protein